MGLRVEKNNSPNGYDRVSDFSGHLHYYLIRQPTRAGDRDIRQHNLQHSDKQNQKKKDNNNCDDI